MQLIFSSDVIKSADKWCTKPSVELCVMLPKRLYFFFCKNALKVQPLVLRSYKDGPPQIEGVLFQNYYFLVPSALNAFDCFL